MMKNAFIMALTLLLLVGCASERFSIITLNADDPDEKTVIRLMTDWQVEDGRYHVLTTVLHELEQQNGSIDIIVESVQAKEYLEKLNNDFALNNPPDIFCLWPGYNLERLIRYGKVADLTSAVTSDPKWEGTFDKAIWKYVKEDDKIYAIPLEITSKGFYINRDLFETYAVRIPTTYEELLDAVDTFNQNGIIPIQFETNSDIILFYEMLTAFLAGRINVEERRLNDSFVKAGAVIKDLYDRGAFGKEVFSKAVSKPHTAFLNKKAAMTAQNSSFINEIERMEAKNTVANPMGGVSGFDIIPFPEVTQGQSDSMPMIYGLDSGTFCVSEKGYNGAKRELIIAVLKKLTEVEVAQRFAEVAKMMTAVKLDIKYYYGGLKQKTVENIYSSWEIIMPPSHAMDMLVWPNIVEEQFPYFLEGDRELTDIISAAMNDTVQ